MFDLSSHDRFFDTLVFKKAQHLAQLSDANPSNVVSNFLDLWISFFADGRDGNFNAGLARAFDNQKRKTTVTCDQTNLAGCWLLGVGCWVLSY